MTNEEIVELIANNSRTKDWRHVQEWFWQLERKSNPTIRILVDGDEQVRQDSVRS